MNGNEFDSLKTLSTQEVGILLGCDRKYVNYLQNRNLLPFCVVGNKRRTLYTDVMAFIKKGGEDMGRTAYLRKQKGGKA